MKNTAIALLTILVAVLSPHAGFAAQVDGAEHSIHRMLVDQFDLPTVAIMNFEAVQGVYVGRCYNYDTPNNAMSGLLMIAKKRVSDNGPMFPPSYEHKAIEFINWNPTYYDELNSVYADLKLVLDANWDAVTEIASTSHEWEFLNQQIGVHTYLKMTANGLTSVSLTEDDKSLPKEERERIKNEAYKRVVRACYYFRKVENSEITLGEGGVR